MPVGKLETPTKGTTMSEHDETSEPAPGVLYDTEKQIEQAIISYERDSGGEGVLLTGWVIVAEWVNADGHPELSAFAREGMPYWRIDALLEAAPNVIVYDDEDY